MFLTGFIVGFVTAFFSSFVISIFIMSLLRFNSQVPKESKRHLSVWMNKSKESQ